MIFGIGSVGKVEITSSTKGIVIMPETCNISIPGEKNKYIRYNLLEGVDINATESLQLNCTATNTSGNTLTAKPSFETHFRTVYGEIVPHTDVDTPSITFNAGEKKDISILLPKALKPQAYDVKVSLVSGSEKSNTITAHCVIQGVSATIQNLSLDKDFYEKGETAKMFFSWSQSADGFPGSRLGKASVMPEVYINAKITNKYGLNCTDPIKQILSVESNTLKNDIEASINRTCVDPKISITLSDKDGNVLDQKDFNVQTSTREKEPIGINIIIAGIILALIIVLTLVYIKNKKGKNDGDKTDTKIETNIPVAIFALLFTLASVGINYPVFKTEATAIAVDQVVEGGSISGGGGVTITGGASTGTVPAGLIAPLSFDLTSYDPNTTATVTTAMYFNSCANTTKDLVATGYLTGNGYTGTSVELFNTLIKGLESNTQDSPIAVPSTPGDYTLKMTIKGYAPVVYSASVAGSPVVTSSSFDSFKNGIKSYLSQNYAPSTAVYNSISNASTILELNAIIGSSPFLMTASKTGGELSFTKDLSYSPVKVRGVDLYVNGSKKPSPIIAGSTVNIDWNATNTTYGCKCTFSPAINNIDGSSTNFCGRTGSNSSSVPVESGTFKVENVAANTTFNVSCTGTIQE